MGSTRTQRVLLDLSENHDEEWGRLSTGLYGMCIVACGLAGAAGAVCRDERRHCPSRHRPRYVSAARDEGLLVEALAGDVLDDVPVGGARADGQRALPHGAAHEIRPGQAQEGVCHCSLDGT